MTESVKIAVDAMGGDNSPRKIIEGILYNHNSKNKDNFYKIFGNKNEILNLINSKIDSYSDLFERGHKYIKVKLDNSFPDFIIKNKQKFDDWII